MRFPWLDLSVLNRLCGPFLLCVLLALWLPTSAHADRPYLWLETASVEHDDENNFEFWALWSRNREQTSTQYTLEYNIDPYDSLELEWVQTRPRVAGPERERSVELAWRHVLVDPHRHDWGLAFKLISEWERSQPSLVSAPSPADHNWRWAGPQALLGALLPLPAQKLQLHANVGLRCPREQGSCESVRILAAEARPWKRLWVFAEVGRRGTQDRLQHLGARWWLQRDRVALQASLSQTRPGSLSPVLHSVHLGLTWSDLDF